MALLSDLAKVTEQVFVLRPDEFQIQPPFLCAMLLDKFVYLPQVISRGRYSMSKLHLNREKAINYASSNSLVEKTNYQVLSP